MVCDLISLFMEPNCQSILLLLFMNAIECLEKDALPASVPLIGWRENKWTARRSDSDHTNLWTAQNNAQLARLTFSNIEMIQWRRKWWKKWNPNVAAVRDAQKKQKWKLKNRTRQSICLFHVVHCCCCCASHSHSLSHTNETNRADEKMRRQSSRFHEIPAEMSVKRGIIETKGTNHLVVCLRNQALAKQMSHRHWWIPRWNRNGDASLIAIATIFKIQKIAKNENRVFQSTDMSLLKIMRMSQFHNALPPKLW